MQVHFESLHNSLYKESKPALELTKSSLQHTTKTPPGQRGRGETLIIYNKYEGHLESKERFAIQRYLLIIGKKQDMQVLSHTFTYFST